MTKRFLSAIILLLLASHIAFAVPASPDIVDALQPDGGSIKTRIRGDEFQNWIETEETGHTIIKNRTSGYWEYAEQAKDGSLRANGIRVLPNGRNAPAALPKRLKPPRNKVLEESLKQSLQETYQQRLDSAASAAPAGVQAAAGEWLPVPVSGNRNTLIILVNFADRTLTTTAAGWNDTIFNTTAGALSVANFYKDNSFTGLSLNPVSHSQSGSPAGIITATISANHPNSGSNFNYASETNILNLALAQAANYITFANYDTNGNGNLEQSELMVYFIYAGYEASGTNATPNIWAHAWGGSVAAGSKTITKWALNGELNYYSAQHPIGVIAHELGHALCGLPDLYDISDNNAAMGNFSLMAGGSWGRDISQNSGTTPTILDAWSREFLGWATPVVALASGSISLAHPLASASSAYKLIKTGTSSTEYFLVENRQPTGWDLGLRGSLGSGWTGGLLITHIDNTAGTMPGNDINDYSVNSTNPGHQGVVPVQASTVACNMLNVGSTCRGHVTTLYYYGNNADWTPLTTPSSNYYNGSATNFSLFAISAPAETMTANLSLTAPVLKTITVSKSGNGSGTVTSSPAGINCGSSCSAQFEVGTGPIFSAVPVAGSLFAGWSGGGCSGSGNCQLTIEDDTTINASFASSTTFWSQNFDAVSPPVLPTSWQSKNITGLDAAWLTNIATRYPPGTAAHSGANLILFNSYDVPSGDAATLVSHPFSLDGVSNGKVKFWIFREDVSYTAPSTNDDRVLIYVNTAANLSGATLLGTVHRLPSLAPAVAADGWYEYTFAIPGSYTGSANYLVLEGISGWGNDVHLDDISVLGSTTTLPGVPTGVVATAGNAAVSVSFTTPADDGNSPILDYTATSTPGGFSATGAASPLTVSNLTNGTAYTFTVTARNSVGSGSPSTPSGSVTPRTVPNAPTIGTAIAGNASASVSFTAPAADGGSTILDYTVTASPDGFAATGSASPITVSGLAIGSSYSFTVTARNIAGSSAASTASNTVSPFTNIKIGSSGYSSVAAAYAAIAASDVLQLRDLTFTETLDFNRSIAFTLRGGYNADFTANSGATTINGSLTITSGTVTLDTINII